MIDLENPQLKKTLKRKSERGVKATLECLNAIKTIEFVSHGKRKSIRLNGKSRELYYKETADKYLTEWRGKLYPLTPITIKNIILDIMKDLDFTFETFDTYFPSVEIKHINIPLKPKSVAGPLYKEKRRLITIIMGNVWKLSLDQLNEVIDIIIRFRRVKEVK